MPEVNDPDNIGWNYHVYRSSAGGKFIADVSGNGDPNWALFVKGRDGVQIVPSHGEKIVVNRHAIMGMEALVDFQPRNTRSFTVNEDQAYMLAEEMLKKSAWFMIEPLPDGVWEVTVKPEHFDHVKRFIETR